MDVALRDEEMRTRPFVFALLAARDAKSYVEDTATDLKPMGAKSFPLDERILPNFVAVTDAAELGTRRGLLTEEIISALKRVQNCLVSVHVSDFAQFYPRYPASMRCVFKMSGASREEMSDAINVVLALVDRVSCVELNDKTRETNEKVRKQLIEKLKKQKQQEEEGDSAVTAEKETQQKEKSAAKKKQEVRELKRKKKEKEIEEKRGQRKIYF